MGDLLFSIVQLARQLGIEPETALRKANDKFTKRFTKLESAIAGSGRAFSAMTIEEMETEWRRIKSATTPMNHETHENTKDTKRS